MKFLLISFTISFFPAPFSSLLKNDRNLSLCDMSDISSKHIGPWHDSYDGELQHLLVLGKLQAPYYSVGERCQLL